MTANPALRSFTLAGLAAAALAGGLYVFGTQHTPDYSTSLFGQSGPDTLSLKSWLATGVLAFAAVQVGLALWIYGKLPWTGVAPPNVGRVHRAVGAAAILLTIPVAYHCAFAYGVQTSSTLGSPSTPSPAASSTAPSSPSSSSSTPRAGGSRDGRSRSSAAPWSRWSRCFGTRAPSGTSTTSSCLSDRRGA